MKPPPRTVHLILLDGTVACKQMKLLPALRAYQRAPEPLYVSWRPEDTTCDICKLARARTTS